MNNDNLIRLENDDLICALNDSGVILELANKKTGTALVARGENLTGWKIVSSLGSWREHPVFEDGNHAKVEAGAEKAVLAFDGLNGAGIQKAGVELDFQIKMTYELCGAELVCQVEAVNNSNETLREIWFPFLSGVRELDAHEQHHLVINNSTGMILDDPIKNLPAYDGKFFGNRPGGRFFTCGFGKYPLLYPGVCSMPWMDYYNGNQGWYLGYHDLETPSTALLMRSRSVEGDMQLGFARYPFIKPGQKWSSGKYIIRCHEGGWQAGARRYAEFAKTKIKSEADAPGWLKDAPGFHLISCIGQDRRINNDYDHIYETFKADREEGLDLPILVFGWVRRGFDNGYPELDPDDRIGGADKLREVINKVQAGGGKVLLYSQGRLIDLCTDFYKTIGKDCCVVSEDGTPYIDEYSFNTESTLYPNRLFALSCPSTKQWEDQLKKQIDIVMGLGADGVLFDQIGADNAFICFDDNHGHRAPDMAFHGKIAMLDELQRYAAEKDGGFAIIGELICDAFLQSLDITHGYATQDGETNPKINGIHVLSDIYRYTFPRHRPSCRMCASRDDYSKAFVNGLVIEHYRRNNDPDIYEYVIKLQKLRASLMEFFNNSDFVDEDGISYQPGAFTTKRYICEDGRHGVATANLSDKKDIVRIASPFMDKAALYLPGGAAMEICAVNGVFRVELEPHTACIMIGR